MISNSDSSRLASVVDLGQYPLNSESFRGQCRQRLESDGILGLEGFMLADAIESVKQEGVANQHLAFYASSKHNVYLSPKDPKFGSDHPRNHEVVSSKGCITTDQIPAESALHKLYNSEPFKAFLCSVLDESELHEYADPLSSVNLHYASEGQMLGWHYDNSSFAITLLIQRPEKGGMFEYVKDARDADAGDMGYELTGRILNGEVKPSELSMEEGALVLFRGRNAIHRVTPTEGERTRMLVVLAYNSEPGIELSESARKTFYGRLN